jgi:hypothetical protein
MKAARIGNPLADADVDHAQGRRAAIDAVRTAETAQGFELSLQPSS